MIGRMQSFLDRNQGKVFQQIFFRFFTGAWVRGRLWRFSFPLFKQKTPQKWVFMGGCYNSGTTIVREMIGAHPEVSTLPREGVVLTDAFPDLEKDGWVRMWHRNAQGSEMSRAEALKAAVQARRDWNFWWRRRAKVFLEKSIVHGAWMTALEQGFENAHFIGMVRNGYCVCEGIRRRAKPTGEARESLGTDDYPIEEVGQQWVFANNRLLRDSPKVQNYFQISYEEFAENPVEVIKEVFSYLGVSTSEVHAGGEGRVVIGSRTFTIRNQNADSLARLSFDDKQRLSGVVGPLMDQMGYSDIEKVKL